MDHENALTKGRWDKRLQRIEASFQTLNDEDLYNVYSKIQYALEYGYLGRKGNQATKERARALLEQIGNRINKNSMYGNAIEEYIYMDVLSGRKSIKTRINALDDYLKGVELNGKGLSQLYFLREKMMRNRKRAGDDVVQKLSAMIKRYTVRESAFVDPSVYLTDGGNPVHVRKVIYTYREGGIGDSFRAIAEYLGDSFKALGSIFTKNKKVRAKPKKESWLARTFNRKKFNEYRQCLADVGFNRGIVLCPRVWWNNRTKTEKWIWGIAGAVAAAAGLYVLGDYLYDLYGQKEVTTAQHVMPTKMPDVPVPAKIPPKVPSGSELLNYLSKSGGVDTITLDHKTIWDAVAERVKDIYPNATNEHILRCTQATLDLNNIGWEGAKHLPSGKEIKMFTEECLKNVPKLFGKASL